MTDPVTLTRELVKCPSVTPNEAGAITLLEGMLSQAGFDCTRISRGGIENLYARWGQKSANRNIGFNGHIDVVPVGDEADWTFPPFSATESEGYIYGRGSTDMKSGVAAFVAAAIDFVQTTPPDGAVILTITGDEEADALDGTTAILDWMRDQGETMQACIVGEPTGVEHLGDTIKIGRRGSITVHLTATGTQGHSAYPHRANNPIPAMVRLLDRLASEPLDAGTEHFDPSTLAIVTVDTGNPATNVIPASCRATINIRFNDAHSGASLSEWINSEAEKAGTEFGIRFETRFKISGESFLTPPGPLTKIVSHALEAETGRSPEHSTSGGTSDARFVKDMCPVVECGLVGKRMHAVDERVSINEIHQLKAVYTRILTDYFKD